MNITNKDIIQSYVLTTAKYDFSIYEKRILYRLIELCQFSLENKKIKNFSIEPQLFENMTKATLPLSTFLKGKEDQNYTAVKNALKSLRNKTLDVQSDDGVWRPIGLIELPKFHTKKGYVEFLIQPEIYDAILSFSKGFRKYELETAMKFESVYSMRFYELLSGLKKPITYTLLQLKEMFNVQGKYKLNADFFRFVVDKAKKELDAKSPYTFNYKKIKHGKKIAAIKFTPVFQVEHRDSELERRELSKKISPHWEIELTKEERSYLTNQFGLDEKGVNNNMQMLLYFKSEGLSLIDELSELVPKIHTAKNPAAWVIRILQKKCGWKK